MKAPRPYYLLLILTCLALACKRPSIKSPAIRDFHPGLQPALITAVATSIVGYDTGAKYIRQHATDSELVLLSRSEHPILRTIALHEMTARPSFNHQKVILEHLDDTAIVLVDRGEFGPLLRTVSDQMIEESNWKTDKDRQVVIDEILRHHDNLRSAYTGLNHVDTPEKYYTHIKAMVSRDRPYEEIEYALYALAKCRKKEDIPLIKDILLSNTWRMTGSSFGLMAKFPDTAYAEVVKKFFRRRFYRMICHDGSIYPAVDFIGSLGSWKDTVSATILDSILSRSPFLPCLADTFSLRNALVDAIWDNPCPAYSRLRKKVKPYIDKRNADTSFISVPYDSTYMPKDTVLEPVRWW